MDRPDTHGPEGTSMLDQLADEVRVQAWLAGAELRHPSLKDPTTRAEVDALARLRDELRVQLALGRLEAHDEFQRIEERWRRFKRIVERTPDDTEGSLHELLRQIRDGYLAVLAAQR